MDATYCPLKKEECDFTKQELLQLNSMTHCLQSSLRKRHAWKLENSFIKEEAKDHVLRSKQIRNVKHKVYLVKKQDHLGTHKAKYEASGRPDATSWTAESQTYLSQRFKSRINKNDKQSSSWSRSLNPISTRSNFFKIWAEEAARDVRKTSVWRAVPWKLKSNAENQQVRWSIAKIAERHESNRNLRTLQEHWRASVPGLQIS